MPAIPATFRSRPRRDRNGRHNCRFDGRTSGQVTRDTGEREDGGVRERRARGVPSSGSRSRPLKNKRATLATTSRLRCTDDAGREGERGWCTVPSYLMRRVSLPNVRSITRGCSLGDAILSLAPSRTIMRLISRQQFGRKTAAALIAVPIGCCERRLGNDVSSSFRESRILSDDEQKSELGPPGRRSASRAVIFVTGRRDE